MKLEIGAGDRPTPGYTHNDNRELPDIEIVCDARDLIHHLGPVSCDAIMANHILEHFSYRETLDVLREWRTLLRSDCPIHIEVPNAGWQTRAWSEGEITWEEFVYYFLGGQDYPGNAHLAAFTVTHLHNSLVAAGFANVVVTDIGQVLVADAVKPGRKIFETARK